MKTILAFLSLKPLTQGYLVKISVTHNKHLTPRFLEDNDPISAKSTANSYLPRIHFSSFEFFKHWFVYFLN